MENVSYLAKEKCCGCSGCAAICPKHAITMKEDSEGFLYPEVNDNCINCGLCLKVCAMRKEIKNNELTKVYAVKNLDEEVLKKATSGGMSRALADYFIANQGVVYGVSYNEKEEVEILRFTSFLNLDKLYGSKYVQANPRNTFELAFQDLKAGKMVLFIATSCYIAGLKAFLNYKKCDQTNLYTVDLICHGTPSPKIFQDYLTYLKQKYDFDHFEFRTKKLPWGYGSKNFGSTIYCKNGKEYTDTIDSKLFLSLFFSNYCLRPHCHECEYAKISKPADFTIADYWGLKIAHPDFFDEKGVSALIVHTKKGEKLFKKLDNVKYIPSTIEKVEQKQGNLTSPSSRRTDRNEFWDLYYQKGFLAVAKKYGNLNWKNKLKNSYLYKLYLKLK